MSETYFYTEHFTGEWSSGPATKRLDPDTTKPITCLDRARELAEQRHKPGHFSRPCRATYGIEYSVEVTK